MKVYLYLMLVPLIVCCTQEKRNLILEKEYVNTIKTNQWLIKSLEYQINESGDRPKDVENLAWIKGLYDFKYGLSFRKEKNLSFPDSVMKADVDDYLDRIVKLNQELFKKENRHCLNKRRIKDHYSKFKMRIDDIKSHNQNSYYHYLTTLIAISQLEHEFISAVTRYTSSADCLFCFKVFVAYNKLILNKENSLILSITDDFYLERTRTEYSEYSELVLFGENNQDTILIEIEKIGNMAIVSFTPTDEGIYFLSGKLDIVELENDSAHIYDFEFNKRIEIKR